MSKDGVSWTTRFTESYTFTDLSEATAYTLRVQSGLNSGGTIAWGGTATKSCSTAQSVCAPAKPSNLLCAATTTTIEFSWGSVTGAHRYQASKDGGATWTRPNPINSTSHTFTELTAATSYALSVQASKTVGTTTAWSPAANKACPTDAPP